MYLKQHVFEDFSSDYYEFNFEIIRTKLCCFIAYFNLTIYLQSFYFSIEEKKRSRVLQIQRMYIRVKSSTLFLKIPLIACEKIMIFLIFNWKPPQKLASYVNENITLKRETCEILNCREACNVQDHARIETSWLCMFRRQNEQKRQGGENVSRTCTTN